MKTGQHQNRIKKSSIECRVVHAIYLAGIHGKNIMLVDFWPSVGQATIKSSSFWFWFSEGIKNSNRSSNFRYWLTLYLSLRDHFLLLREILGEEKEVVAVQLLKCIVPVLVVVSCIDMLSSYHIVLIIMGCPIQ